MIPHQAKEGKMKEEKYKILFNYGAYEGMKFYDDKYFDDVDQAVKFAVSLGYGTKFMIVKIAWNTEP